MPKPIANPNYKPSPQPNRIYSGPEIPAVYDENWQHFTNLTKAQIAAFQAMPEWQNFKDYVALSPKTATVATPVAVVRSALAGAKAMTSPASLLTAKTNG